MLTCSITYIAYSSCCFIRKACIWFRKILRWLSLSRNGTRMATRCRDVQFSGTKPPSFITLYFCSIVVHVCGSVLLTVMLPTSVDMRKHFIYFLCGRSFHMFVHLCKSRIDGALGYPQLTLIRRGIDRQPLTSEDDVCYV